jgi:hypothetical protein
MVIAFIVLAVVALIFLFVYNSRVSRKAGKRVEIEDEPVRPDGPETKAAPAELPAGKTTGEVPSESGMRHAMKAAAPRALDQTALKEAELEAHRSASGNDQAYREALRKFAGYDPDAEKRGPGVSTQPEPSSDEAYRQALRAMARGKEDPKDAP